MPTFILLISQIYQAPESVVMNHRIHYFHGLVQSYFYHIKAMSLITDDHFQWIIICKKRSVQVF